MKKKKICLYCGKSYIDNNKMNTKKSYCSKYCGRRYRRKTGDSIDGMIKRDCLVCGNIFYVNKTQLIGGSKYCSKKCSDQSKRYTKRKEKLKLQIYTCKYCRKKVAKGFSRLNKYCSRECYNKHKNEKGSVSLVCSTCKNSFSRIKSQWKKDLDRKQEKFYCSKICFTNRGKSGNKKD